MLPEAAQGSFVFLRRMIPWCDSCLPSCATAEGSERYTVFSGDEVEKTTGEKRWLIIFSRTEKAETLAE